MMNNEVIISPNVEEKSRERSVWGPWATTGFGVVVLVVFVIAQVVALGISGVAIAFSQATGTLQPDEVVDLITDTLNANMGLLQSIATIAAGIIGTGLILIVIKARKRAGIAEYLGLNKISLKAVLLSIGIVVGFIVVADGLQILLGNDTNEQIMYDIYDTSIWPPLFWIAVIIFAPLFEEAFFRGFLFEGFRQSRPGAIGAIAITALTWALLHSLQYSIANIVWILVLGIMMGVVRLKTRSIWSTFIMHALVNLIATLEVAFNLSKYIT